MTETRIKEEDNETEEEEEQKEKTLTEEELQAIAEEVKNREKEQKEDGKPDLLISLLKRCINTILLEEIHLVGEKMNTFRRVLAEGVLRFCRHGTCREQQSEIGETRGFFPSCMEGIQGEGRQEVYAGRVHEGNEE